MSRKVVAAFLLMGMTALSAQAQSTVKELLDKGGKKLTAAQIKALAPGQTLSGVSPQPNNKSFTFAFDLGAKGELTGKAWTPEWMVGVNGTWTVNEVGQFCTHVAGAKPGDKGNCSNLYVLDKAYYAAVADDKGEALADAATQFREFTPTIKK